MVRTTQGKSRENSHEWRTLGHVTQALMKQNCPRAGPAVLSLFFFFLTDLFNWRLITLQYCSGVCHTLIWINHGYTCVPHPDPPSHLPPHPMPQGHTNAPALSTPSHASNLDWWSISHIVIYMFQCYSLSSVSWKDTCHWIEGSPGRSRRTSSRDS